MGTQGVNGASNLSRAQLVANLNAATTPEEKLKAKAALFDFDEAAKAKGGAEVEHAEAKPLTDEEKKAKAEAKAQQNAEIAKMKEAATAKDAGEYASDTKILKEETEKLKTKEGAAAEGFEHARKVSKAARRINGRLDSYEAVEKIYTNKDEYKAAVKQAKADGTWDKDNPKYTLLDGKALEGAKRMQEESSKKVDEALKNYNKFKEVYENPKTEADKMAAFKEMVNSAKQLSENYNTSKMFNEDGSINKDAYQKAMLQFSGTDMKANLDERKGLKESADVSKRKAKEMFEAAGLDVEKDYTWAMRGGALAVGVGTGALAGLLGGGLVATAVATATATATATVTNSWTASNGEEFFDQAESSDTQSAAASASDKLSGGQMALRTGLAALPAAILSAVLIKDKGGKDAFNGLSAEQVLKNAKQVKGKANQEIMQKIIDLPNLTTTQKAAIIHTAYGNDTGKKVNTEELVAAYSAAKYLDSHPELVTPQKAEAPKPPEPPKPPKPPVEEPPCIKKEDDIAKDVTVKHRSGMGPYQYAEALGIPAKYRSEFIAKFREDNNMDRAGTKFNKTPVIQKDYTFKDGTTVHVADEANEAQDKIDKYNLGKVDPFKGKQHSVRGREVQIIKGQWVYCDTGKPVSQEDYDKYVKPNLK